MARARNIKPAFFMNEDLAEIAPLGRLLFIGLWCAADREGRLEDRPKRLAAEILPYDDADVDELLQDLHVRGFILRYQAGDLRFIQVVNFGKHQNPHHQERESRIPAPDTIATKVERTRGRPSASPELISDKSRASSEAIVLIPDSLIPDSFNTPKPPRSSASADSLSDGFTAFWSVYPAKKAKAVAAKAWAKLKPDQQMQAAILAAVERDKASEQWSRDSGRFIPHPATWLNQRRWEDEAPTQGASASSPTAWWARAGFANEGDAADAGCWEANWREFQGGQRAEVSA